MEANTSNKITTKTDTLIQTNKRIQPVPTSPDALSNTQLERLKKNLNTLIDSFNAHPSIVTRASLFWAARPLWQKIGAGALLVIPLLITGIAAHIAVILTLSIVTFITYTASGFLLENHHSRQSGATDELKLKIAKLTDMLGEIIQSLEKQSAQLKTQIETFETENKEFSSNIKWLNNEITQLSDENNQLKKTEVALHKTQEELQIQSNELKSAIDKQSELLVTSQLTLKETIKQYEKNQTELSEHISKLKQTEEALRLEVKNAHQVSDTLKGTVKTLANSVIGDEQHRTEFLSRLDNFMNNKDKSLHELTGRIEEAEAKLACVTEELNQCNERYHTLLDRHELHVKRLEQIDSLHEDTPMEHAKNPLFQLGFYAHQDRLCCPEAAHMNQKTAIRVH